MIEPGKTWIFNSTGMYSIIHFVNIVDKEVTFSYENAHYTVSFSYLMETHKLQCSLCENEALKGSSICGHCDLDINYPNGV